MQKTRLLKISYAWVILGVSILGMAATFGMRASFGTYISAWENEFSANRTAVTSISTLSFIFYALGQPLAGRLHDHFGKNVVPTVSIFLVGFSLLLASRASQIWQLFILYGVLFSLGYAGCSSVVFSAIITNWFHEKRGFALGLCTAGMGIGQLILVPANNFIMSGMGWRFSLAVLSAIIMLVLGPLFIILLRSKPSEKGLKPYGSKNDDIITASEEKPSPQLSQLLRNKTLWLLAITYFICGFSDVGLIQTHLFPIAQGKGFSDSVVVLAFSLMAIANIGGTVVMGHLSDRVSRKKQLAFLYLIRAATYVFLIFIRQAWMLVPFAIIFGAVDMASSTPTIALIADSLNGYSVGAAIGIISLFHQMGGAAGSWLPGLLYDMTGTYLIVMVLALVMLVAGALLALRIRENIVKQS